MGSRVNNSDTAKALQPVAGESWKPDVADILILIRAGVDGKGVGVIYKSGKMCKKREGGKW